MRKGINKTHGATVGGKKTGAYLSWSDMKKRCGNANCKHFAYYGGRGIKVCERWVLSFADFLQDMGDRPDGLTLDRIDPNGNYEPSNCRWATRQEQSFNQRRVTMIEHEGVMLPLCSWAPVVGLSHGCLQKRYRQGLRGAALLNPMHRKSGIPARTT